MLKTKRPPASTRVSTRAEARSTTLLGFLDGVARGLADNHLRSPRHAPMDSVEGPHATARRWSAHLTETRALGTGVLDHSIVDEIECRVSQYISGRAQLFEHRVLDHRVVCGHGALLADDVFGLLDGARVLDCLDCDGLQRVVDGIDEAASLAMELEYHGHADLGRSFLDSYREAAIDAAPSSLVHHYTAYRSFVCAKQAYIRLTRGDTAARVEAHDRTRLALEHLRAGTVTLTLVGGLPRRGRTALAERLAVETDAISLSSDAVRTDLAGLDVLHAHRAGVAEGIRTPGMTGRTYYELLRRAHSHLVTGRSVVLDADWMDVGMRGAAVRLSTSTQSTLVQLQCVTDLTALWPDAVPVDIDRPADEVATAAVNAWHTVTTRSWTPNRTLH